MDLTFITICSTEIGEKKLKNRNINTNVIKYTRYIRQLLDPHNATFLSVIYVILSNRTQSHTQSRRSNQPWEC